jgi:hypothetical protein
MEIHLSEMNFRDAAKFKFKFKFKFRSARFAKTWVMKKRVHRSHESHPVVRTWVYGNIPVTDSPESEKLETAGRRVGWGVSEFREI